MLDIKMPRKDGYDVLQWLRVNPFAHMTAVILSDSALPDDVARSFALGAQAHFRKTSVREENENILRQLEELADKVFPSS
jgi:two-component system response regulator